MVAAALLLLALADAFRFSGGADGRAVATVGYLPEWRYEGANWETLAQHLTHIVLFSAEPTDRGDIVGLDRLPRAELLKEARAAAARHGAKLLVCFGGNGRSSGFSPTVRSKKRRALFVSKVKALVARLGLDGVDLNWEYPGYSFGSGYHSEAELERDYAGLAALARGLRRTLEPGAAITMAYYPDGKQEGLLLKHGLPASVDLLHMMTYDQSGGHHSTLEFAVGAIAGATRSGLPLHQLTLGLPFYGRHSLTGDWTTYEDLVQRHHPLHPENDTVALSDGSFIGLNGRATIAEKTRRALAAGLGGLMIWEAGQDCRMVAVTHGGKTHGVTCPDGQQSSLLVAMSEAVAEAARPAGHARDGGEL